MLTDTISPAAVSTESNQLLPIVRQLSVPCFSRWLQAAMLDWAIIAGVLAGALAVAHPVGYVLTVLVLGTRQHALGILGHEGAHFLVTRRKSWNDLASNLLCFFPLGFVLGPYREFHLGHHRNTGNERDPELEIKRLFAPQWDLPARPSRIAKYCLLDLCGTGVLLTSGLVVNLRPRSLPAVLGFVGWWTAAVVLAWATGYPWVILGLWFAALVISMPAVFRLRMWTEHVGTGATHRISALWWQRCIFLPHYTWYHDEHHRWTSIPCWNLSRARVLDGCTSVQSVGDLFATYRQTGKILSGQPLQAASA
jgi:fatty acid desaturase